MPTELGSRVFSSETLVEGLAVVKAEIGMADVSSMDPKDVANIEEELKRLEACPK